MEDGVDLKNVASSGFEWLLNHMFPAKLNENLMKLTDTKWRRKWNVKGYPREDYELAFKTTLHISKNHPANYQKKILKALSGNGV